MNASEPYRVLFVCLGNICRSPAAEIIFKKMVKEQGLESLIESDSAGMIGYHRGCPPDARMVQALEKYGYQNPGVKSRPVRKDDLEQFDLVVGMDRENLRQSMQVINEAADVVKEGKNVILFPEGTRSRKGNQLLEFKSGSFKIAVKAKCPIVPVALKNCFVPFDSNTIRPVTVEVHFLDPIPYEEYQGMKTTEIAEMVKKRIEAVVTA